MTRAAAQEPNDLILSSTTENQEQLDHAVGENWKQPYIPAAQKDAEAKAAKEKADAEQADPVESGDEGDEADLSKASKEPEKGPEGETPEQRAQRLADEKEPVKGPWSKRVNKLTARNARLAEEVRSEREAREKLEARLQALERGEKPGARGTETESDNKTVADLPGKPKRIDFTDEEQYVEKLIQWTRANEDHKEGLQQENERRKEIFDAHRERLIEARERYGDEWDEAAEKAKDMRLDPAVEMATWEFENSGDVLFYLANHRDEYTAMSKRTPFQQVAELGRISDKLAARAAAPRKNRPAPPEPINAGGKRPTKSAVKLEDIKDGDEYYRARLAMRRARN